MLSRNGLGHLSSLELHDLNLHIDDMFKSTQFVCRADLPPVLAWRNGYRIGKVYNAHATSNPSDRRTGFQRIEALKADWREFGWQAKKLADELDKGRLAALARGDRSHVWVSKVFGICLFALCAVSVIQSITLQVPVSRPYSISRLVGKLKPEKDSRSSAPHFTGVGYGSVRFCRSIILALSSLGRTTAEVTMPLSEDSVADWQVLSGMGTGAKEGAITWNCQDHNQAILLRNEFRSRTCNPLFSLLDLSCLICLRKEGQVVEPK